MLAWHIVGHGMCFNIKHVVSWQQAPAKSTKLRSPGEPAPMAWPVMIAHITCGYQDALLQSQACFHWYCHHVSATTAAAHGFHPGMHAHEVASTDSGTLRAASSPTSPLCHGYLLQGASLGGSRQAVVAVGCVCLHFNQDKPEAS